MACHRHIPNSGGIHHATNHSLQLSATKWGYDGWKITCSINHPQNLANRRRPISSMPLGPISSSSAARFVVGSARCARRVVPSSRNHKPCTQESLEKSRSATGIIPTWFGQRFRVGVDMMLVKICSGILSKRNTQISKTRFFKPMIWKKWLTEATYGDVTMISPNLEHLIHTC